MAIKLTQSDLDLTEEISLYARISVDTEKESDENTSIENQLKLLHDHIRTHFPKCTYREYIDRDRSGYTFEQRENYMEMRRRLLNGKSRILIIKDFSRFSRRTSKGLAELEDYRDNDVRIISVMDSIDFPADDKWEIIAMRFIMNEMPVTDTSKKVRTSVKILQEAGEWICAVPYGYVITNAKKRLYEVVPDEAEVIKEIFRLYAVEGWGYKKIANHLTDMGIPTARMKEKQRAEERGDEYRRSVKPDWSIVSIQGILKNDFYVGTLRQRKYSRKSINSKDTKLDEGEHLVFLKHHEQIIDDKLFKYTQELLKKRTTSNYRGVKKYDTMYSGVLFCGDCGSPMFSMSRPDLAPAYTCGKYHKQGLKGCTSHHIRTDFLDAVLKDYLRMVKENSVGMIRELEAAVAAESTSVKENSDLIDLIESQLYKAKEELKATQKQKIKAVMQNSDAADIYEETYREIESEILGRIESLTRQRELSINKRSQIIELAMASKTVFDVFDNVLNKDKLDKVDIALIVDRINVHEGGIIDIRLKADIEALLKTGKLPGTEVTVNFNWDSIDSSNFTALYSPAVRNQRGKVYTVNVIKEGDPLEIYTAKDGEVIFKKYSPMGEFSDFAANVCETLNRTTGHISAVADRDSIIAVSGVPGRELNEKRISSELERLMENRQIYQYRRGGRAVPVAAGEDKYKLALAAPIIAEGDVLGGVIFLSDEDVPESGEIEYKLAQTVAGFLGNQLSN